jgi:hypothetical protein
VGIFLIIQYVFNIGITEAFVFVFADVVDGKVWSVHQIIEILPCAVFVCMCAFFSVDQLQRTIARVTHIPADKQILLISGGQSLDAKARVCSYSAGTVCCCEVQM